MAMVGNIDSYTVHFGPNYDGQEQEPQVLPAAIPNLLVNGTSGIAVGMATNNTAPHNLTEVIAAARHLIRHPDASLEQLMRFVPGPDLPTGGRIVGLDGVPRGVRDRPRHLPHQGRHEDRAAQRPQDRHRRHRAAVRRRPGEGHHPDQGPVQAQKFTGISDLKDLTHRTRGLHLVIEVRNGFNPDAVLAELYRLTPMEETFGINNVALLDGQPRAGLLELLTIYVDHRLEVTRRRSEYRRRKRQERLHLVDGIIVALLNIDEAIQVIRSSDDAAEAKSRRQQILRPVRDPGASGHPAAPPDQVRPAGARARAGDAPPRDRRTPPTSSRTTAGRFAEVVSGEMAELAKKFGTPRRTVLLEGGDEAPAAVLLEVADDPCVVVLSATGLLAASPPSPMIQNGLVMTPRPPPIARRTAYRGVGGLRHARCTDRRGDVGGPA